MSQCWAGLTCFRDYGASLHYSGFTWTQRKLWLTRLGLDERISGIIFNIAQQLLTLF